MTTWIMALVPVDADEATTENSFNLGNRSGISCIAWMWNMLSSTHERLLVVDIVPLRNVFFLLICCATTMNSHDLHREGPFFVS